MKLVHDFMLPYRGYYTAGGLCRVRIYYPDDAGGEAPPAVAIISEIPENDNTSVTNLCETLFCELSLDRALPEGTWFVEHYPRDDNQRRAGLSEGIDLVSFSEVRGKPDGEAAGLPYVLTTIGGVSRPSFGAPDWRPLERGHLEWTIVGGFEWEPVPDKPTAYASHIEEERRRREDEHRAREAVKEATLPERPGIEPAFAEGSEYLVIRRVDGPRKPGRGELQTNVVRSVVHHSPDGFEIGYAGSGPADLALNVLSALMPPGRDDMQPISCFRGKCSQTAWILHQGFKEDFLAGMAPKGETMPAEEIREWLRANRQRSQV